MQVSTSDLHSRVTCFEFRVGELAVLTKAYRSVRIIPEECLDDSLEQVTITYFLPSDLPHADSRLTFDLLT